MEFKSHEARVRSVATWHLLELRDALKVAGWTVIAEHPGDDRQISATWELRKTGLPAAALVDFEGIDDLKTLPIERSYGCHLRDRSQPALYFRRKGHAGSRSRHLWLRDLADFVESLSTMSPD